MSRVIDSSMSYLQKLCANVLKRGPVPKHVAFIMDGNRRYAKKTNDETIAGHRKGADTLAEIVRCCLELGIKEVTVYAFSIENFKRSPQEVSDLIDLFLKKFQQVMNEKEKFMQTDACVRVIGNLSLLSERVRKVVAKATLMTKDKSGIIINVAFSYTSRDEITNSIRKIVEGIETKLIEIDDIDEQLISDCLYTNHSSNPDMLVRTSGEVRFSDFLLWQISKAHIYFVKLLWPEYYIRHFYESIFRYQRCLGDLSTHENKFECRDERVYDFLKELDATRMSLLETYAKE